MKGGEKKILYFSLLALKDILDLRRNVGKDGNIYAKKFQEIQGEE